MPINGSSLGRDISVVISTSNGLITLTPDNFISLTYRSDAVKRKTVLMNGTILYQVIPSGFSGSIMRERKDNQIEQFWSQYENDYYSGINLLPSTITDTIAEADGSITQTLFTGVFFDLDDFGDWSGNELVKQKLGFSSSRFQITT